MALDAGKWTRVQNSLCYSAVIGSYYRLGEFQLALQYYEEARKLGVFPRFREGMMVAEIHATSREFEAALRELRELRELRASGVSPAEASGVSPAEASGVSSAEASGVSSAERWAPGAESSVESGCGRTKPSCRRCGAGEVRNRHVRGGRAGRGRGAAAAGNDVRSEALRGEGSAGDADRDENGAERESDEDIEEVLGGGDLSHAAVSSGGRRGGRTGWMVESKRGDPGEGCPGVGEEPEVAEFESSMGCLLHTDYREGNGCDKE